MMWPGLVFAASVFFTPVWGQTCVGGPIVGAFDPNVDYFANEADRITPTYAKNFEVVYKKYYKEVTIRAPSSQAVTYTLYLCNSTVPSTPGTTAIAVPVSSVAIGASDIYSVAFIERLGLRPTINYVGVSPQTVTSPCLLRQLESNVTKSFIATDSLPTTVTIGFGTPPANSNIPFISVVNAMRAETSPLARAEWVKFFSLFYNNERNASATFANAIERPYKCLNNNAPWFPINVAWIGAKTLGAPTTTTFESIDVEYNTAFIRDAGGRPLILPPSSKQSDAVALLWKTDLFIDGTETPGSTVTYRYTDLAENFGVQDIVSDFPFGKGATRGRAYRPDQLRNPSGYDMFPQNHWAKPELVLKDLLDVFGDTPASGKVYKYFRSLNEGDPEIRVGPASCVDPGKPTPPLELPATINCNAIRPPQDNTLPEPGKGLGIGNGKGGSNAVITTVFVILGLGSAVLAGVFRHELREMWWRVRDGTWRRHRNGGGPFDDVFRQKARQGAIELR
ncbi:hypothetical protein SpCBS45565_g04123 [Spizellomyces sp. 'palustris']|nr:hypothetical protein SpCBS45565_g04123 [Spizellomyces sp. 'palustris']